MKRPDPVQHMMTWGAISSGIVLLLYFLLTGFLNLPDFDPLVFAVIIGGIFIGFTLGGMAGVIIGTVFQHEQEALTNRKIHNRRILVLAAVFIMVLIISRILIIISFGFVGHPLALSLLGAVIAAIGSQHYLHRMENWLKQEKPKRKVKNEDIPTRLLDSDSDEALSTHYQEKARKEEKYR